MISIQAGNLHGEIVEQRLPGLQSDGGADGQHCQIPEHRVIFYVFCGFHSTMATKSQWKIIGLIIALISPCKVAKEPFGYDSFWKMQCFRALICYLIYRMPAVAMVMLGHFDRPADCQFMVINPIFMYNFKWLCCFLTTANSRVQNFEPHPILNKWFKNNRFFNFQVFSVKNYELESLIILTPAIFRPETPEGLISITNWILYKL